MQNWIESEFFGYWKDAQSRITRCLFANSSDCEIAGSIRNWNRPPTRLIHRLGESVVRHSLELQTRWIDLWIRQFENEAIDLQGFSKQVQRMNRAMQEWSGIQKKLWEYWFSLLDRSLPRSGDPESNRERLETLKKVIKESEADLNHWFTKWEEQINCKPLVPDALNRLIDKVGQEMLGWIQNQTVLWTYGFDFLKSISSDDRDRKGNSAKLQDSAIDRVQLTEVSRIRPVIEHMLNQEDIVSFREVADLSEEELSYLENNGLRFPARSQNAESTQEAKGLLACDGSE